MLQGVLTFLVENWPSLLWGLIVLQAASVGLAILSERREPAATIAWLMTVTFLPVVGILAYYALARTRFRRQFRARAAVNEQADEALSMYVEQRLSDFDETLLRSLRPAQQAMVELAANSAQFRSGGPPSAGNAVRLFFDAKPKYDALKDAIRSAQSHVHLGYYIFNADGAGTEIRDLLAKRAAAGVEVRVLYDGVGSIHTHRSGFFDELTSAGGEAAAFLPPHFAKIIERVNFRNHRKIAVIDGHTGYTGSQNIVNADYGHKDMAWHDMMIRLRGPVVLQLQAVFASDWFFESKQKLDGDDCFPEPEIVGNTAVQTLPSGPSFPTENYQYMVVNALYGAKSRVTITSPYFVPDEAFLQAVQTAVLRGVKVEIVLPNRCDQILVGAASRSYYDGLLASGVDLYLYQDGLLHSKTMSIDGSLALIGSSNFDIRSFAINFEINLLFYDNDVTSRLRAQQQRYIAGSILLNAKVWQNRSALQKTAQNIANLLSPLL